MKGLGYIEVPTESLLYQKNVRKFQINHRFSDNLDAI